jgi:hypothetical protein
MQNQIRAEICKECQGEGINPKTGASCENCRGIGAIGNDGTYEYYLTQDNKGNLRVGEVKNDPKSPDFTQKIDAKDQRRKVLRGLVFVMAAIIYCGYLGAHFIWIRNTNVLIIVTTIIIGFLVLYLLYDFQFLSNTVNILLGIFIKQPDDFMAALQKRTKKEAKNQ